MSARQRNNVSSSSSSNMTPDYYRIIGVLPTDSTEAIRNLARERLKNFHPDKVNHILSQYNGERREKEKRKLEIQYNLVYEAYQTLKDPEKRKDYDIKRRMDNSDFFKNRESFNEYIELQKKAEPTPEELNNRKNFMKCEKPTNITTDELSRRLSDLEMQRKSQDCEYVPDKNFNPNILKSNDFHKHIRKSQRMQPSHADDSIVCWGGVCASNDMGIDGTDQFTSLDNYGKLYNDNGNMLYDNYIYDVDLSNDRDQKSVGDKLQQFMQERNEDLNGMKAKDKHDSYWRDTTENPFNISNKVPIRETRERIPRNNEFEEAYKQLLED